MPYPPPSRKAQARIRCRQTPHNRARPPRPASRCARTRGTPSLRRDGKGLWRCYHRRTRMSVQQRARLRHQSEISGLLLEGGTLQWLVDRELGAQHVMAYRLTLDPDSALSHVHRGTEEVLYVLDGRGEVRVEGVIHHVAPGHAFSSPAGAEHAYVNTGAALLTLVGAMAPPIELGEIRPAIARLDLSGLTSASLSESGVTPRMMDEREVTPTLMGERSFRVLVSPDVGCRQMTQFTGVIPTGRASLHAHPHEEAVYILAGTGPLRLEDPPVGHPRARPGVFFPIGVRHTLENSGRDDMKVLGAFSPAGAPEDKLRPSHQRLHPQVSPLQFRLLPQR